MIRQFYWEMTVGIIGIAAILMFGAPGAASFALMVLTPVICKKHKPDEREYFLFYKTGNYTMGIFILVLVLLDQLRMNTDSALLIQNQLGISISAFLFIHGITGIIMFKKN